MVKNPPDNAGDMKKKKKDVGSIPGLGRSLRRAWQPTPILLPADSHGQKSLVAYSP